jgi:hypothetical protein
MMIRAFYLNTFHLSLTKSLAPSVSETKKRRPFVFSEWINAESALSESQ